MTAETVQSEGLDLAELKRVAREATPGPWAHLADQCVGPADGTIIADYSTCSGGDWEADAAFIATFDPPTVLSLLDRLSKAEGEREDALRRLKTAELLRDNMREIAIKLGGCPRCGGLHGSGPCLPPTPAALPPHKMMG
jgi:hypothetical protein